MSAKFITNYKEFGGNGQSVIGQYKTLPEMDKAKILKYLKNGNSIAVRCSLIKDWVNKTQTNIGIKVRTDGEYEWADDEIYHFEHYDIELDENFVRKVLNNK